MNLDCILSHLCLPTNRPQDLHFSRWKSDLHLDVSGFLVVFERNVCTHVPVGQKSVFSKIFGLRARFLSDELDDFFSMKTFKIFSCCFLFDSAEYINFNHWSIFIM